MPSLMSYHEDLPQPGNTEGDVHFTSSGEVESVQGHLGGRFTHGLSGKHAHGLAGVDDRCLELETHDSLIICLKKN